MEMIKKVIKISKCLGIVIPTDFIKVNKIKSGDYLKVEIKEIIKDETKASSDKNDRE